MLWHELTKITLLGTTQAGLSDELRRQLQQQGLRIDAPDEELVLEAAALLGQLRKAGFPLQKTEQVLPAPAPTTSGTFISVTSARHLEKILDGTFALALPEYFYFLQQYQKMLLPEILPDLLQACIENPEFWEQIAPLLGERGQWLIAQNPKWQPLLKRKLHTKQQGWQADEEQAKQAQHYIHTLKRMLSGQQNAYFPNQDDRQKLRYAAYEVDPENYDIIADGWNLDYRTSMIWESELGRLLKTVAFRRAMRKELSIDNFDYTKLP